MTNHNSTTSSADSGNKSYPTPVTNLADYRVAEDTDDYTPQPAKPEAIPAEMKRYELRAKHMTSMGHIGRLYQLSRLLEETQAIDWTPAEIAAYAKEIHKTATDIQYNIIDMISPLINDPDEPDELEDETHCTVD